MENTKNGYKFDDSLEHIAIIGMTGRFPGAKNINEFWQNLRDGVESITFFTREDLEGTNIDQSLLVDPRYVGADGVIDDMDMFDAEFFNITPREAELMDPQHRLFLECAWELMESAGYDSESYDGRVAVYGSANLSTYLIRNILSNPELSQTATSFQTMITNDKDFVATRVSYKMNLKGPSMSVATLCSSSSLAIHLACQALLNYQCDLALAGAISLQISRNEAFFYQEGGIGDPDGHCRAFDALASGTVSGSGIGLIAVKRLEDALENGDTIHAVIRATAINNDGALKYSYTAPSIEGQSDVIAEAISLAEVDPETITYIETHGTGTHLGDPIEIAALTKAFRGCGARKNQYCAIGSVKTNIGHLVNAGGVASLIKTVLAMKHDRIPASLNFETPNPEIDFENSPFFVNTELRDWQPDGAPRRAGVSSFGIGGTNVHIVVEEAPEIRASGEARAWQLLVLSAKTSTALEAQTANMLHYLQEHPNTNLADVAYTLQVGRRAFSHRRMLLCRNRKDAISKLMELQPEQVYTQFQESKNRPVVFLFPGTVPLHANPGKKLYEHEPVFRQQVDACSEQLLSLLNIDLRTLLYPAEDAGHLKKLQSNFNEVEDHLLIKQQLDFNKVEDDTGQEPGQPGVTHAAVFVLEYALAKLYMEWGVSPKAMIGEGVGNYVTDCLSGKLSREDALTLAVRYEQSSENASQNSVRGVEEFLKKPEQVLLEVGFHQSLSVQALKHPEKSEHQIIVPSLPPSEEYAPETASLLKKLGKLWLAGVKIDWNGFHTHTRRHRLPLPTYPFEHKRYWIEPGKGFSGEQTQYSTHKDSKKADIAEWFYLPVWKTAPLPKSGSWIGKKERWLLFVDGCGVGSALGTCLQQAGQEVMTIKGGDQFNRIEESVYTLNLRRRADYAALFRELQDLDMLPDNIIHLWSITSNADIQSHEKFFRQTLDQGFSSVLFLAQTLGEYVLTRDIQLWVVSNNTQKVESMDIVYPEKATLLGVCKVIPQENPRISSHYIDVTLPETHRHIKCGATSLKTTIGAQHMLSMVQQLLTEIRADLPDSIVAYRDHQRWLPDVEPIRLTIDEEPIRPLRKNGVYLVTSGLIDISLALIHYLAQALQARLVVIEREDFPPRETWMQRLVTDGRPDDIIARKIRNIRDLEQAGAEVLVINACLTDVNQLQDAITRIETRFGALHGVIHAVGDMGNETFKTIQDTDEAEGIWYFALRMQALFVLEKVLAGRNLDFCLLVSSLASVLGGLGLAAYTAANLFMDAFVTTRRGRWLSINWDAWKFETEQQHSTVLTPQLVKFAISPAEGIEVFQRILSTYTGHQVIVSTRDLQTRIDQWNMSKGVKEKGNKGKASLLSLHPRPNLRSIYVAPTNSLEKKLVNIWQEVLGVEPVGIHDNFFELGGDSLLVLRSISEARKAELNFTPQEFFKHQTIAALVGLEQSLSIQAEQGIVTGPVPLTANNAGALSSNHYFDVNYHNLVALFEVHQEITPGLSAQIVRFLIRYHDGLRSRFVCDEKGWRQFIDTPTDEVPFIFLDLSALPAAKHGTAIESAVNELHRSFNLSKGLLLRIALFHLGTGNPRRLLFIAHHAIIDAFSWQIFLRDFRDAYLQCQRGEELHFPPKTTSLKQWTERLHAYAHLDEVQRRELDYWIHLPWDQVAYLPVDFPEGLGGRIGTTNREIHRRLSHEDTSILLRTVPNIYQADLMDAVVMALVETLGQWADAQWVHFHVQDSGRRVIPGADDLDLSRTVGNFLCRRHFVLEKPDAANPGDALRSIHTQLRRIPNKGFGYSLLRYCSGDDRIARQMASLFVQEQDLFFNYLGQENEPPTNPAAGPFRPARESTGARNHPNNKITGLGLRCDVIVTRGCLRLNWSYNTKVYHPATMEQVVDNYLTALRDLIEYCHAL